MQDCELEKECLQGHSINKRLKTSPLILAYWRFLVFGKQTDKGSSGFQDLSFHDLSGKDIDIKK